MSHFIKSEENPSRYESARTSKVARTVNVSPTPAVRRPKRPGSPTMESYAGPPLQKRFATHSSDMCLHCDKLGHSWATCGEKQCRRCLGFHSYRRCPDLPFSSYVPGGFDRGASSSHVESFTSPRARTSFSIPHAWDRELDTCANSPPKFVGRSAQVDAYSGPSRRPSSALAPAMANTKEPTSAAVPLGCSHRPGREGEHAPIASPARSHLRLTSTDSFNPPKEPAAYRFEAQAARSNWEPVVKEPASAEFEGKRSPRLTPKRYRSNDREMQNPQNTATLNSLSPSKPYLSPDSRIPILPPSTKEFALEKFPQLENVHPRKAPYEMRPVKKEAMDKMRSYILNAIMRCGAQGQAPLSPEAHRLRHEAAGEAAEMLRFWLGYVCKKRG